MRTNQDKTSCRQAMDEAEFKRLRNMVLVILMSAYSFCLAWTLFCWWS